jgi:hypothetical protein
MLFNLLQFLTQTFVIVFLLYKSLNLMKMMQSKDQAKEQLFLVVTSWILFLSLSSMKCSCGGMFGCLYNMAIQGAMVYGCLQTSVVQKKVFEENTLENIFTMVKGMVEKYMPKQKAA